MIFVIATIELKDGQRAAFLREFHEIVPLVRTERGCLEYGPTVDIPTTIAAQPSARPNVVTVVEKWDSLEDLEAHLVAEHMLAYRKRVKDLVVATVIHVLEPA